MGCTFALNLSADFFVEDIRFSEVCVNEYGILDKLSFWCIYTVHEAIYWFILRNNYSIRLLIKESSYFIFELSRCCGFRQKSLRHLLILLIVQYSISFYYI